MNCQVHLNQIYGLIFSHQTNQYDNHSSIAKSLIYEICNAHHHHLRHSQTSFHCLVVLMLSTSYNDESTKMINKTFNNKTFEILENIKRLYVSMVVLLAKIQ